MIPTITLIIQAPADGGRVVHESVVDEYGVPESRLVFGGDVEQANKYIADRNAKMDQQPQAHQEPPLQIEPPVKARMRRPKSDQQAPDPIDALELLEGEAD